MIKGKGMPIFGSEHYGDLYVEYKVVLPLELSSKMRQSKSLLRSLAMNLVSLILDSVPYQNWIEPLMATTAVTIMREGKVAGMSYRYLYVRLPSVERP